MAGETERRKAQNIILENRSRLSVSGVEEVSGFDESIVQMQTELGALTVHGSNLRVETLSVDSGDLLVVGDISDLSYADVPVRRSFWAWLFEYTGLRMGEANGLQWKMMAQQLLGHADIMTTRRIYQHLREGESQKYTALLDAYVSGKA